MAGAAADKSAIKRKKALNKQSAKELHWSFIRKFKNR